MKCFQMIILTLFIYSSLGAVHYHLQIRGVVKRYDQETVTLYREYEGGIKRLDTLPRNLFPQNLKLRTGKRISIQVRGSQ